MDTLPNEILLDILEYLSQRYVITVCSTVSKKWNKLILQPWLFSTIHIHNKHQLERIIQFVRRRKTINNKPISYYVECIIFHFEYSLEKGNINILSLFPNLRRINGLDDYYYAAYRNKPIYLQLRQSTDFTYSPQDEQWTRKFNNIKKCLKSLYIYISDKALDDNDNDTKSQQVQQTERVYMKTVAQANANLNLPTFMLILPSSSLMNLVKLKIDFLCDINHITRYPSAYNIDQHTLENIHQSCPLLESLSIENFNLTISDEYYENNKNDIVSTHHLKNIDMSYGRFYNPHCFSYLATKYPQLESLVLKLDFSYLLKEDDEEEKKKKKEQFHNAVLNMFPQLLLLKKFSYNMNQWSEIWPCYGFFQWLNLQSNRLTHLKYNYPLTENKSKELATEKYNFDIYNSNHISSPIPQQQQQFNYLNHLTSLSIGLDNTIDLAFTFLLEYENTTIVSSILQELNIEVSHTIPKTKCIYIYDCLDMFPNINSLSLMERMHIIDNGDLINNYMDMNSNDTFNKLHQLIKNRKQQQQKQEEEHDDTLSKMNNDHQLIYKLKSLKIVYLRVWFENGFDEFLKKCHQLKTLELVKVAFINPMDPFNEIYLDLSNLHLDIVKIAHNFCAPMNKFEFPSRITKLIIDETAIDCKRIMENNENDQSRNDNTKCILNLKCKFIDAFTFIV